MVDVPAQESDRSGWLGFFRGILPLRQAGSIRDALAGLELAATNIPQVLGYTKIAGTPVVTGLYTLLLPLVAFATFGSSRYLVVAADSATAAILAGGVARIAPLGSARYVALAALVALLTALLLLIARVLKLGFLADFLSQTVLLGFLMGVGFQVGIAVLGEMLGLEVHSHRTVAQLGELLRGLPHANLPTLLLSLTVVAGILGLHRLAPRVPGPLIAVVAAIAASAVWDFAGHGIGVIGPVARGLPHLGLPDVTWRDVEPLIPVATSCFVMILTQSAATARVYALRHDQDVDEEADIVGLSAANAAAALSGTFVVNGSPTQTAMAETSGAKSQIAQLAMAGVVAIVLLFLTKPFQYLPRCVLGAIVFLIAARLIDFRGLARIGRESPGEYWLALLTAAAVVLVGVEQGTLLAMLVSLLRIVRHSYHPHTAVLVEGERGTWRLTPVAAGAVTEPGLVVYRFGAVLFYANARFFSDEIRHLAGPAPLKVRWIVVDAGAITHVDYTAARVMQELQEELARRGVTLLLAHVQSDLKPDLDRHGLTKVIGPEHIFDSLHEALAAFHAAK